MNEILKRIVEKGHAQVTTEEVREDIEKKRREVIHYLASKYVDNTGKPHPVTRIESALDQIKGLTFDPKRSAADIASENLRKIVDSGLSMKKLEIIGSVTVHQTLQNATQGVLKKFCSLHGTSSAAEGQVVINVGLNPSDLDELLREVGRVTKGEFSFDLPDSIKKPGGGGGGGDTKHGGGKKKGGA